jgi:hypothetical protein
MDPILGDSSSIRPQAIGGLIQDGFTVLGRCYRQLLPLAAAPSAIGYLAAWIIARSAFGRRLLRGGQGRQGARRLRRLA